MRHKKKHPLTVPSRYDIINLEKITYDEGKEVSQTREYI